MEELLLLPPTKSQLHSNVRSGRPLNAANIMVSGECGSYPAGAIKLLHWRLIILQSTSNAGIFGILLVGVPLPLISSNGSPSKYHSLRLGLVHATVVVEFCRRGMHAWGRLVLAQVARLVQQGDEGVWFYVRGFLAALIFENLLLWKSQMRFIQIHIHLSIVSLIVDVGVAFLLHPHASRVHAIVSGVDSWLVDSE